MPQSSHALSFLSKILVIHILLKFIFSVGLLPGVEQVTWDLWSPKEQQCRTPMQHGCCCAISAMALHVLWAATDWSKGPNCLRRAWIFQDASAGEKQWCFTGPAVNQNNHSHLKAHSLTSLITGFPHYSLFNINISWMHVYMTHVTLNNFYLVLFSMPCWYF